MSPTSLVEPEWLRTLSERQPIAAELLARSTEEQRRIGYFHTLREICQQPATWLRTCALMQSKAASLRPALSGISSLILTGSGSSEYAGDCVRLPLQNELGVVAQAIAGGALLAHGSKALPPRRPGVMVSIARSGDSPESAGALALMLKMEPEIRHVVLTCNQAGSLARTYENSPRAVVVTLPEETNDQGLVMTSSFTNLVLAARFLGLSDQSKRYGSICEGLSRIAARLIEDHLGSFARIGKEPFKRALFLGSGARYAAARESGLKMLEMTAGRVTTMSETYLGVRHGPMSYVHEDTLVVCFLSSDPTLRLYEADLLRELDQKELGLLKVMVGEDVPADLVREGDVVVECNGLRQLGDENSPVIDVIVGQLLAFFRCLEEGLRPDSPSENGVISRVVQTFALHLPRE
ncbi:MAG TPA: SIS domain-containing protein [Terriglobales bacterium]|nr:SIS domain-containing protein [Terriglobales bacterium]